MYPKTARRLVVLAPAILGGAGTSGIVSFDPGVWQFDSEVPTHTRDQFNAYRPTRRIYDAEYGYHVFATNSVSDHMIPKARDVFHAVLGSMHSNLRNQMRGHYLFLITDEDPDVLGGIVGQKNTGYFGHTIWSEGKMCTFQQSEFAEWNTPVHEVGHAIELNLGLRSRTAELSQTNALPGVTVGELPLRENFAWFTQGWFGESVSGYVLPVWARRYLEETFRAGYQPVFPSCD